MAIDTRDVQIVPISARQRLQLQRLADRLAAAEQLLAEASAEKEAVRDELYALLDEVAGADSYTIYEALDPHRSWRMVREISYPRDFDVDGLKRVLTQTQFRSIARILIDTRALDVALRRGALDAAVIERYTTRSPRARGPLWRPSAGDIHLAAGQLALISHDNGRGDGA